jgi:hypothetical protein
MLSTSKQDPPEVNQQALRFGVWMKRRIRTCLDSQEFVMTRGALGLVLLAWLEATMTHDSK